MLERTDVFHVQIFDRDRETVSIQVIDYDICPIFGKNNAVQRNQQSDSLGLKEKDSVTEQSKIVLIS